jgi:hypothetical protein
MKRAKRRPDRLVNRHNGQTMEKNCSMCNEWKPRAEFALKGLYLSARCKKCVRSYHRQRRELAREQAA